MPIFTYECKKCKKDFEGFNSNKCPECNEEGSRVVSQCNFVINGSCTNPLAPININYTEEVKNISRKKVLADWYCPACNHIAEDEFRYHDDNFECPECSENMTQHIGKLNFKLLYDPKKDLFDWQGNKSQFWSSVKEERRKGNKVKGSNEK